MHPVPHLRCLLLCDLANSTGLIEQLGDARAAELIRQHDRLTREALHRCNGQEIDKTDGFLLLFERPIEALRFALGYQRQLRDLGERMGYTLRARVGIHVGEILSWRNSDRDIASGAKPQEVEGLAKALTARLMTLALPGQILLSESAYSLAQRARAELDPQRPLRWLEHGRYRLQGIARPVPVFEVGEPQLAPLSPPASRAKARRMLPWYRWKPVYAALALLAVVWPLYYALQPAPAIAFAQRDWIVVADLRNLTADSRFDESLDAAIRIGLEQSQHVNLVAQLKTRDTLKLMQREPRSRIDRELGSELAQRIGAKAVLLPSIAEIGGRLRFSAELIDPLTQITVYSDAHEVADEADVLTATDQVLRQVRGRLGETLSAIQAASPPLAQVTTSSLEALRAYSLAVEASSLSKFDDASRLIDEAVKLDPEFARAMILQGSLAYMRGDAIRATALIDRALALSARLGPREQLYFRAVHGFYSGDPDVVGRWQLVREMYPDEFKAMYFQAKALAERHQWTQARQAIAAALNPLNPNHRNALYLAGLIELAELRIAPAVEYFRQAEAEGVAGDVRSYAYAEWLAGDAERAQKVLTPADPDAWDTMRALNQMGQAAILIDQGRAAEAATLMQQAVARSAELAPEIQLELRTVHWIAQCAAGAEAVAAQAVPADPALMQALQALPNNNRFHRAHSAARALLVALGAVHCGDVGLARQLLRSEQIESAPETLAVATLRQALQQELLLADGRVEQLVAAADSSGSVAPALYLQGDTLRRAYQRVGKSEKAQSQAEWLLRHSPLSFVEFSEEYAALMPLNASLRLGMKSEQPRRQTLLSEQTSAPR